MSSPARRTSLGQQQERDSEDASPHEATVCAVDIPGASRRLSHDAWQVFISSRDDSDAGSLQHMGESRSLGTGLFGSLSGAVPTASGYSYGASPGGYGVGHLMRNHWNKSSYQSLSRMSPPSEHGKLMVGSLGQRAGIEEVGADRMRDARRSSEQMRFMTGYRGDEEAVFRNEREEEDFGEPDKDYESFAHSGAIEGLLSIPLLQKEAAAAMSEEEDNVPIETYGGISSIEHGASKKTQAFVFGILNAVAGIPALIAYAAIVFKDESYSRYIDPICKLFFLSSAVHQAVFCLVSKLPFAVGQVQDVGIIFLSSMATSISSIVSESGRDIATAVGTSLLTMSISTLTVGAFTLLVSFRSWARFISFIPLPVMGGYLSFVGYFCIASGIGLGCSVNISSIVSWGGLFQRLALIKLLPTVASCAAIMLTLQKAKHPLALPSVLILLVGIFHIVRLAMGISLEDAEKSGWVMPPAADNVKFWELYKLYNLQDGLSGIAWIAILKQVGTAIGLIALVIFGSAMDILAIQTDVEGKIDTDRELLTVGISNVATGALGIGFPGSYIFSQTLVTMRSGVSDRLNGWTIVAAELLAFALPFSIVTVVPNYFLGGLLLWFGVEIGRDWLVLSFFKLTHVEYVLLLVTFFSVIEFGLQGGIAAGVVAAAIYFTYAYSESQIRTFTLTRGRQRSSVVRSFEQQQALDFLWLERTAAARVQGFVFFGTAHGISTKLASAAFSLKQEGQSQADAQYSDEGYSHHRESSPFGGGQFSRQQIRNVACNKTHQTSAAVAEAPRFLIVDWSRATGCDASAARTIAGCLKEVTSYGVTPILTAVHHHKIDQMLSAYGVHLGYMKWPPEFHSPDAFSSLADTPNYNDSGEKSMLHQRDSEQINEREVEFSDDKKHEDLNELVANYFSPKHRDDRGVPIIDPNVCLIFDSLEEGLRYCEDVYLQIAVRFGLCTPQARGVTLSELLRSHLETMPLKVDEDPGLSADLAAAELQRFMGKARKLHKGQKLWDIGDLAKEMYIIQRGVLRIDELRPSGGNSSSTGKRIDSSVEPWESGTNSQESLNPASCQIREHDHSSSVHLPASQIEGWKMVRSYELGSGCLAGTTDFFLGGVHATRCRCVSDSAWVMHLDHQGLQNAAMEAPTALNALQLAIMRSNSSDLIAAAETNVNSVSNVSV